MIKKICLFILLVLLFFPLLEQCFSFNARQWKIKEPNGYFPTIKAPTWSINNWKSGNFQDQTSQFLKRNMSVRPLFYRFSNQLQYSLLKKIRAKRVVEGKEGYLYELGYIEAFYKADLIEDWWLAENLKQVTYIKKTFKERYQTELLIVLAPSKASYYPEYMPDYFQYENHLMRNASAYKQGFQQNNIPYIDFDSYFVAQKENTPYPLFPKLGTHWSWYGGLLAADSILHSMGDILEQKVGRLDLTQELTLSTSPMETDDDIGKGLNLLQKLESDTLAYFENIHTIDSTYEKPKVILIGDSFVYTLWHAKIPHRYFDKNGSQFWYYFDGLHTLDKSVKGSSTRNIDWLSYAKAADIVVMIYTPNTIKNFGNGFIQESYKFLQKEENK